MSQFVGHCPAKQKVSGSIPGQGASLGCGLGSCWHACERQLVSVSHIDVFLPLFLPPFPSLQEYVNTIFLKIYSTFLSLTMLQDNKLHCFLRNILYSKLGKYLLVDSFLWSGTSVVSQIVQ